MYNAKHRGEKGFSLLELLIAVSIVLILTAVLIPNLIASSEAANESAAVSNLSQLVNAENSYHNLAGVWAPATTNLGGGATCPNQPDTASPPAYSCLISTQAAIAMNAGATPMGSYTFTYIPGDPSGWAETAVPTGTFAGRKAYWVDASGTVRYVPQGTAPTAAATPIGQ